MPHSRHAASRTFSGPRPGPGPDLFAVAAAAASAAIAAIGAAATAQTPRYTPEQFYDTLSVGGATFSPDGSRILFATDATGVFNLVSVPAAGGEPTPLTNSTTNAIRGGVYFPADERLIYSSDGGGNELFHVYVREADGTVHDLTPGDKVRGQFAGFDRDDPALFIQTNERDPRFLDLYRYATDAAAAHAGTTDEPYPREMLYKNEQGYTLGDISRDGTRLIAVKVNTNKDNDLFLIDLTTTAEPRLLTPNDADVSHGTATFTPEGDAVLFTSDEGSDFQRLWRLDLATGEKSLFAERDWDIAGVGFSYDGRYQIISVNADARTRLEITDRATGSPLPLPPLPAGDLVGVEFSRDGTAAVFTVNGDRSPTNIFAHRLGAPAAVQLTSTLSKQINADHLVDAEMVRYKSFDGLDIPAVLVKPRDASPTSKVPAVVWVHGGPGGQSRGGYSPDVQALANHGYAVLMVNNRGSSGYGTTFFHLDDKKHGDVDLKDCVFGRKYLESLDWVDGSKVAIMGGSYGGYMVCAALAFEPQAFNCGVNIFGVTNWVRTLESIPPWWAAARDSLYSELGDPAVEGERLRAISPLFHAKNIVKPMLVVQGANDPRVLQVESDEIVKAVKDNGVPCEYVLFPDEGHGFSKKANRITALTAYLKFLDEHLRGGA